MHGDGVVLLVGPQLVEVVVEAEVEEVVDQQLPQVAAVPLEDAGQQHDEKGVGPDAPVLLVVEPEVAGKALEDEEHGPEFGVD